MTVTGGPEETRTPDLLHAMEALYQLRYRPMTFLVINWYITVIDLLSMNAITGAPTCAML